MKRVQGHESFSAPAISDYGIYMPMNTPLVIHHKPAGLFRTELTTIPNYTSTLSKV